MSRVRDIMTPNPVCCTPDTDLESAARMMCDNDCGEIPVVDSLEDAKPLGVVTDRDIVCRVVALGRNPLDMRVSDCMTTPCVTVAPETSLRECCDLLEKHQIRRVPVVDRDGRCCGIVAQADIALKGGTRKAAEVVRRVSELHI